MNLFILLASLWVINTIILNKSTGLDERFTLEYDNDKEIIYRIYKHNHNLSVLKKLQTQISIPEKIEIINHNDFSPSVRITSLKAGGLMNDWDFEEF